MRPKGDLRPEIGEKGPVLGGDARPPEGAHDQACRKHRHHARHVEKPLGHDEGEIGEGDREGRLREPIVARPRDELEQDAASERAERGAADEGDDELDRTAENIGLVPRHDHAEEDDEKHDRGRIVEESFSLDQPGEARRRADIAENRDHGRGIRGRDHGAEKKADDERHAGERPQGEADDRARDQRRDDREHQDRGRILEHAPHIARERGLEHKKRQEDIDEGFRADREIGEELRRSRRSGARAACAEERSTRPPSRRRSWREARQEKAAGAPREAGSPPRRPARPRIRPG